jgi:hypothetical protein
MRRAVEILLALVFLCASNAHLPILQVVAWAGMLVKYSQNRTLAEAAAMTFDGEHPCPMCKAIKKQQEQAPSLQDLNLVSRPIYFLQLPIPWIQQLLVFYRIRDVSCVASMTDNLPERMPPRSNS